MNEIITSDSFPDNPSAARIALTGDASAREAASLHQSMLAALEQGETVEVDARTLTSIDTSLVQILLAGRKSAERLGRQLIILREPAGALTETLERLGLPPTAID